MFHSELADGHEDKKLVRRELALAFDEAGLLSPEVEALFFEIRP